MKMKDVLEKELELISISKGEVLRLKKVASDFIKSLKREGLKVYVGGSLAKNTMIRKTLFSEVRSPKSEVRSGEGKQDVDIFVVFDYSEDILKLEGILKGMELPGKLKRVHGSRDYFHIVMDDIILEVVPVVKNRDPELAENVTDVSLSHVKYIVGEIKKNPGIADEIKLAKAFCRAQRCYGAEGYVRGFSGYSLEVLVIFYGSFLNFLKKITVRSPKSEVRSPKIVIDPLKYFKSEREIMRELNSSKLQGPVVVVDPTYKFRNVCAGLGLGTFERFLKVSGDFLKNPSSESFERKGVDVEALRALVVGRRPQSGMTLLAQKSEVGSRRFLELEFSTDRQEGDIAGTKMRKLFRFFIRELERNGQMVLREEFDYDGVGQRAKGYLVVLEKGEIEVRGPSIGLEKEAAAFLAARKSASNRHDPTGPEVGSRKSKNVFKRKGFWWFRKRVSVEGVVKFIKRFEREIGSNIEIYK